MDVEKLKQAAIAARMNAYAPYSHFRVGAALLDEQGRMHAGCNVENAALGPTNCAERTALFRAVADGAAPGTFRAIAVAADAEDPIAPCGVCRQVLAELCPPGMPVYLGNVQGSWVRTTVRELLPGPFTRDALRAGGAS